MLLQAYGRGAQKIAPVRLTFVLRVKLFEQGQGAGWPKNHLTPQFLLGGKRFKPCRALIKVKRVVDAGRARDRSDQREASMYWRTEKK